MARSCGIRIGPRHFELFVLDGNPKKPKVVTSGGGELPPGVDGDFHDAAQVLKEAVKSYGIPKENVGLVLDSRHAAFRRLQLPFADPAKIESVIKFEVEGQLPQFNVDEVVVDFQVLETSGDQSALLVTANPKEEIRRALELCHAAGFEPLEVELEASAMVNAAIAGGISGVDDAQVLVHVGEESTAVAVVDGTKVREMRTIQIGAYTGAHSAHAAPAGTEDEGEGEADEDAELESEPPPSPEIEARRLSEIVGRIRRELARTVSAARTANELSGVYTCGFDLPGLCEDELLGVPVQPFGAFELEVDDGTGYRSAAVAFGGALRQLGGGMLRPRLRREELKFTGALERLELPLAVVCLLLVTLLGVWNIFLERDLESANIAVANWRLSSNNYMYGKPTEGQVGVLKYPSDKIREYVKLVESEEGDPERDSLGQIRRMRSLLDADVKALEKELGRDGEVLQPQSALHALTLVMKTLDDNKATIQRPSIRQVQSRYVSGKGARPDLVNIRIDITFFATDVLAATQEYEAFEAAVKAQPWCTDFKTAKTESLEDGMGIHKAGIVIDVDLARIPEEVKS